MKQQTVAVSLDGASGETYMKQRGINGYGRCMRLLHQLYDDGHRQVSTIGGNPYCVRRLEEERLLADFFPTETDKS